MLPQHLRIGHGGADDSAVVGPVGQHVCHAESVLPFLEGLSAPKVHLRAVHDPRCQLQRVASAVWMHCDTMFPAQVWIQRRHSVRYKGRRLFFGGCYPPGDVVRFDQAAMPPAATPNPDRARRAASVVPAAEAKDEFVPEPLLPVRAPAAAPIVASAAPENRGYGCTEIEI